MSRFLADENLPGAVVRLLTAAGHDVLWVRKAFPGIQDTEVLQRAQSERRLLLTFDKDFGELAFHSGLISEGIVLFRLTALPPDEMASSVVQIIGSRSDWAGAFSVVEPGRIRRRPLPTAHQ